MTAVHPARQRLRDDADFRRFWLARVASLTGTAVTAVALPVIVYAMTRSPLLTALVSAFEAVPYLLLGLFAGALADRHDRRRVMIAADLLNALVVGSVPLAAALGVLTVPHVLACAVLGSTLFVFFDAAEFGALPALVGAARVPQANSAVMGAGSLLEIAVPAAAGALLAVLAAPDLLAYDALTYVASALLVRGITRPLSGALGPPSAALRADVAEGLRHLWERRPLRAMTAAGALQSVAGGAFVGQLVVWADRDLDVRAGDVRLGLLFASWGVGGVLATAVMPVLVRRFGAAGVTLRALPVSAALAAATALAPAWPVACVLLAAWGAAYMLVVVNAITYRQQTTPPALMSRVNTTGRMLSFGVGWPLGSLLGGVVSQLAGARAGMLAGTAVLAVGVVVAWRSPLRAESRQACPVVARR